MMKLIVQLRKLNGDYMKVNLSVELFWLLKTVSRRSDQKEY
ncbi:MAG: hypothetical protein Q8L64_01870 [bacterium]|nr:hypothetical protein [bacterium]